MKDILIGVTLITQVAMNDAIPGVGKLDKNVLQHCLAGEGRRRGGLFM